ncbi:major capsid protein [Luteolibacter arcticus]|uniref:Major capsid protein n=1 Tax=Luteolibacter arcticus TaxID=1581411 RepID=A0ABT3GCZ1_9BACT|nr:major capsid protein [Luteolibacter arcticus]MCW1921497.1 major capsid protein [Luteolibacter arcticus]
MKTLQYWAQRASLALALMFALVTEQAHAAFDAADVVTEITTAQTSADTILQAAIGLAILFMAYKIFKRALGKV